MGTPCSATWRCAPGLRCWYVDEQDPVKKCVPPGQADDACKLDEECEVGLGCSYWQGNGLCAPLAIEDQPCTNISCQPGLFCSEAISSEGEFRTLCRPKPAGALGGFCNVEDVFPGCEPGLICGMDFTCRAAPKLGQSCTDSFFKLGCEAGAFCASDGMCHSVTPAIGELCLDEGLFWAEEGVRCAAGSYCREESGWRCVAVVPLGGDCDNTKACAERGFCNPAGKCSAPAAFGQSCAAFAGLTGTCAVGYCGPGHQCEAKVADGGSCPPMSCGRYTPCDNTCKDGSYCSPESSKCFETPVKDGPCVAHVPGDDHFLCQGSWCCPKGQTCNDAIVCTDTTAKIGDSCLAANGDTIHCVSGAYCNSVKKCQAFAETYAPCGESSQCTTAQVCRAGALDGVCEQPQ